MSEGTRGYLPGQRNDTPSDFKKWRSPYEFTSEEIDILQRMNLTPTWSNVFAVSTAQTPQQPLIINQPGRAFRVTGLTTATKYDPVANTGIETVASSVFVGCFIYSKYGNNQGFNDIDQAIFLKHGSGFRGDFMSLGLFWPAQSSNSVRITIYRYDGVPWQNGDTGT